tara:strand:+ start:73 stop:342 length:270 start_codon:yes stop_codon:yes gene_type:complete
VERSLKLVLINIFTVLHNVITGQKLFEIEKREELKGLRKFSSALFAMWNCPLPLGEIRSSALLSAPVQLGLILVGHLEGSESQLVVRSN